MPAVSKDMHLNTNVKFWLNHQVVSYINKQLDLNKLVRFDMGECAFGPRPELLKALSLLSQNDFQEYGDPVCRDLKQAIATFEQVDPRLITIACGSDELIEAIPRMFLNSGNSSLVVTPTFFRFIDSCLRQHSEVIEISAKISNGFAFDEQIAKQVIKQVNRKKVKLVWLCNPNNPTGQFISPRLFENIASNTNALIVIDGVFSSFIEPLKIKPLINLAMAQKNVIWLNSLSKVSGAAGLRIGWAISHSKIINLLEKWRLPFNIPIITQKLALATFKDSGHLKKIRKWITGERNFLFNQIINWHNFELVNGSQTNVFLLRHIQKDLFIELLKRKIIAADFRQAHGLNNQGFVRVTIQKRKENLILLKALNSLN